MLSVPYNCLSCIGLGTYIWSDLFDFIRFAVSAVGTVPVFPSLDCLKIRKMNERKICK